MALTPCIGPDFLNYETRTGQPGSQTLNMFFEQFPAYFEAGYGCALIREAAFDPIIAALETDTGTYLKPGQSFPRTSLANINFTWPPPYEDERWTLPNNPQNFGFAVEVIVIRSGVQESRGFFSVGYMQVASPTCPSDDNVPHFTFEQVVHDGLTGYFPIVIGEDGVTGIIFPSAPYAGPPPFTGVVECLDSTVTCSNDLGNPIWPSSWSNNYTFDAFTTVRDAEGMWCCLSFGYDCCGTPPIGGPTTGFLIPPPLIPGVGEEKVSSPILRMPLYLVNHTFSWGDTSVQSLGTVPKRK